LFVYRLDFINDIKRSDKIIDITGSNFLQIGTINLSLKTERN